jgi:hypothetical protein
MPTPASTLSHSLSLSTTLSLRGTSRTLGGEEEEGAKGGEEGEGMREEGFNKDPQALPHPWSHHH